MTSLLGEVVGNPKVSRWTDGKRIAIWAGPEGDHVGLLMDEAAALVSARKLVEAVGGERNEVSFVGELEGIAIDPPTGDVPGRLVIRGAGHELVFFIDWANLIELSRVAGLALQCAPSLGRS
jgi:hypothetical protein